MDFAHWEDALMMRSAFRFCLSGFVILLCCVILFFCACETYEKHQKIVYYSEKENYIEATAVVDYINYKKESQYICLGLIDIDPNSSGRSYFAFQIVGKNADLVFEEDIESKLEIGDAISFVEAPGIFWNGYEIPIVGLTVDGEVLLEFDEGYTNLLEWLKE